MPVTEELLLWVPEGAADSWCVLGREPLLCVAKATAVGVPRGDQPLFSAGTE